MHIAQRKRTIPHSMMKTNRNIIECCNNTHQGAPHTANKHALAHRTSLMGVTLVVHLTLSERCCRHYFSACRIVNTEFYNAWGGIHAVDADRTKITD